ncbi:MAG: acetyl-CoA C-acyltransferase [Planctomycetes bacterium]|nr:acetyl-CoA C-acyltransferase [Planctomycetota bacterium]
MSPTQQSGADVVITHALRTPIGKYLGGLADLTGVELGVSVVKDLFARAGLDPREVDEVFLGNGRQAGAGPNVARQVAFRAGVPETVCATTVNMACGSGLKTLQMASDAIRLGRAEVCLTGGFESMSGLPFFLPGFRRGYRLGHDRVVDAMYKDGFDCPLAGMVMGGTAEKLAQQYEITRREQDEFALASQDKAAAAVAGGAFADELSPVEVPGRKGQVTVIDADEHIRFGATMEGLAKLPGVFGGKEGTVTAGNSSGITDGAAALLVMSAEKAARLGLPVLAHLGPMAQSGVDPTIMGIGPVPACRKLSELTGRGVADYDLIELNEAFAAQVLACHRELDLPMERVNVHGGAIALGHPIGATGARIVVTLLHAMKQRGAATGLATLCISGGMGLAAEFTRP